MTREEAIYILDNLKPTNTKSSFDAYVVGKAITMAINALSAIEDIKAEIAEYKDDKIIHLERNEMVDHVLEIIDRHFNGKEIE